MPSAGYESPCRDLGGLTRTIGGARNRSQHSPITHQPFDAEEERGCAEKRSASVRGGGEEGRRRKGHKGPKSDCGRGEARPAIFCPTRGSSDYLVGQLRKDWRELPLLELQIEDSIRRLDAF